MAFPNKIPLTREDGCVMDSDLKDLPSGAPSTTPSSSWIPKEFTNSSFTGTGFSDTSGRLVFLPVQPVADTTATASVNCFFYYEGYAVYGCPVDTSKSNAVTFRTVDTDSASATTTRTFKVVNTGTYSFPAGTVGFPSLELKAEDVVVQEGHKVSVRLTTSATKGVIVPSRSFLTVDNAGFSLAQRTAEYMYNTLANLMFTNGNPAELTDDGIITGKWSPEVVQFNS